MNELKVNERSIQRWESEGGALLPADCNMHFWKHRMVGAEMAYADRYRTSGSVPEFSHSALLRDPQLKS